MNAVIAPAEATNQNIVWSMENGTGAATISSTGLLTGVSPGTVIVTAAAADGSAEFGSIMVTVVNNLSGSSVTPAPSPAVTTTSAPLPTPAPTPLAGPAAKFADQVGRIEEVVSGFNKKIDLAKANPAPAQFTDISAHWAGQTVETFVKLGVVQGYQDGGFRPNASITRAEFAAVIARVFDLSGSGRPSTLSDINGHWAAAEMTSLQEKGLVSGYPNGTFQPNGEISRAEMIAIISRIVDLSGVAASASAEFSDVSGTWNQEQIQKAAAAGIVSGSGSGQFLPAKQASRAEALTIVLRVLQLNPELKALLETLK